MPSQPVPSPCTNPSHSAAICASVIPRLDDQLAVLHGGGGDLVREPHALDLLLGLDRAGLGEERRRVLRFAERVEPVAGEGRGLADHAIGSLGSERQLQSDGLVLGGALPDGVERACERWSRVRRVVPGEEADVRCPGGPFRVVRAGLEADEDRLALARKHADVVALHPPEVGEVEDVVGRADDERVQPTFVHQLAHPIELGVVARPGHASGASSHTVLPSRVTTRPMPEPG